MTVGRREPPDLLWRFFVLWRWRGEVRLRALRKIKNNAVICLDSTGQEMIAMGKGLGFGPMPREISLAEVERTFYNIDERYVAVMRDLPADVLDFSARIIDIARN